MPSLDMRGPFDFDVNTIDAKLEMNRIGNYAFGYINDDGVFIVEYVGRSDEDLLIRLKKQFNENGNKYLKFKFSYTATVREAFEKECRNYHDFKPRGNSIHPARPKGYEGPCPVSGCDKLD